MEGESINGPSPEEVYVVGIKLQSNANRRRNIKNRIELIRFLQRQFGSEEGKKLSLFLTETLKTAVSLKAKQDSRIYIPRTDELDDITFLASDITVRVSTEEIGD